MKKRVDGENRPVNKERNRRIMGHFNRKYKEKENLG
jgi:hypothetical protein